MALVDSGGFRIRRGRTLTDREYHEQAIARGEKVLAESEKERAARAGQRPQKWDAARRTKPRPLGRPHQNRIRVERAMLARDAYRWDP